MEYGDAINADAFARAISIAREFREERTVPLREAAMEAVAHAYCVCVTDGEDAAEHRFSDVHRKLVEDVAERVRELEARALLETERKEG